MNLSMEMTQETQPIVIRKYANRKYYDTSVSSYIKLEDIEKLTMDGIAFVVIDNRTQTDITRNTQASILSKIYKNRTSGYVRHYLNLIS